jgi:hypothetical protein
VILEVEMGVLATVTRVTPRIEELAVVEGLGVEPAVDGFGIATVGEGMVAAGTHSPAEMSQMSGEMQQ